MIGDEITVGGERCRVVSEKRVDSFGAVVRDEDGRVIRKALPLAYVAVRVEPIVDEGESEDAGIS